jgi:hypothetical protein
MFTLSENMSLPRFYYWVLVEDIKGVFRSRKAKDMQHSGQHLEDIKGEIKRKSVKQ